MISWRNLWTTLLVGMSILISYSFSFSQMTPANSNAVVAVANNWLHLGQEMGWGWMTASDFTLGSIHEIEYEGELLAFNLPMEGGGYIVIPAYHELPPITAYSTESSLDVNQEQNGFCGMLKEVLSYKVGLLRDYMLDSNPPPEWMVLQDAIDHHRTLWGAYTSDYQTFTKAIEENNRGRMDSEQEMDVRYGILDLGPLLTSSWDQGSPYYDDCPWGDGSRCVVGCVATAMAQILNYWEYPPSGSGNHTYWWNGDQSCGGSTSGQNLSATYSDDYDWDNILDDYSGGETQAEEDAVAELCYEAGVSIDMDYGACISGTWTWMVMDAFVNHFRYSDQIDREDRSSYESARDWFAMLQEELDYNRPMQYRVNQHSIVCDGWRVSGIDQIHMNYGWDDSHNTWYTVDELYLGDPPNEYAIRRIVPLGIITVLEPDSGDIWLVGRTDTIRWSSQEFSGNVDIAINRDYPYGSFVSIINDTRDDGEHPWIVTEPVTSTARIRVLGSSNPSIGDTSDADFTITDTGYIIVLMPNGGETWYTGTSQTITWIGAGFSGKVKIELDRDYPSGMGSTPLETLFNSTTNDGSQPWTVTSPTTAKARIRISSRTYPSIEDFSNADFTIADPYITVTVPNGGEVWTEGNDEMITWTSGGFSGNVKIELDRNYPSGGWETIYSSTTNDGSEAWAVTSPATTLARVRISSIVDPDIEDVSDVDFTIEEVSNNPPVIFHDPLDDDEPGTITVVTSATDDMPGITVKVFHRLVGAGSYDSTDMTPTGNPDEFYANLVLNDAGFYEYYLRVIDTDMATDYTDVYDFQLYPDCGTAISYDDGIADRHNWAGEELFEWAVRFTPLSTPFILCGAQVAVSRIKPDSAHSRFYIKIYNESGGEPGSLLFADTTGSVGNVVGGLPIGQDAYWADVVLRQDGSEEPLEFTGDFFISVGNPDTLIYEAFSRDITEPNSGRSFLYDGCDLQWYNENDARANCKVGNRMIRAIGYYHTPSDVVIHRSGDDMELHWSSASTLYYRVYSDTSAFGTYTTLEGSTSDTTFIDIGAITSGTRKFYRVYSSTLP